MKLERTEVPITVAEAAEKRMRVLTEISKEIQDGYEEYVEWALKPLRTTQLRIRAVPLSADDEKKPNVLDND